MGFFTINGVENSRINGLFARLMANPLIINGNPLIINGQKFGSVSCVNYRSNNKYISTKKADNDEIWKYQLTKDNCDKK